MTEEENEDKGIFVLYVCLAPFSILAFECFLGSIYVEWALWGPFWKRYTDRLEGSVVNRGKVSPTQDTVTIEYAATKDGKTSTERRTFGVQSKEGWGFDGKPSRGFVSRETYDATTLTVRVIPDAPGSGFPEEEWKLQQAPYPLFFYIASLICIAFFSYFLGVAVPLFDEAIWKERAAMVTVALYLSLGPVAFFLSRKGALASMERQKTATNLTLSLSVRQELGLATYVELPVREEETEELTDDGDSSAYNDGGDSSRCAGTL
jgi:hypothetical protein